MYILLLLSIVSQFLTIEVREEGVRKVIINVPRELVEEALEYAKESSDSRITINDEEIPADSIFKLLKEAEKTGEPVLEIEDEDGEIIKFYLRDKSEIIRTHKKPRRLVIDIKGTDHNVLLRFPLWFVKCLPSFVMARGENAKEIRRAKRLIRKTIDEIKELEGGFNLIEIEDEGEKVRIAFE